MKWKKDDEESKQLVDPSQAAPVSSLTKKEKKEEIFCYSINNDDNKLSVSL